MSASNSVTRIVFLDRETLSRETTIREPAFPTELIEHDRTRPDEVAGRISEAEIVITNKVPLGAEVLAAAPRLKLIAVAATGYDRIDLDACRERGITVCNIRAYAGNTVPEHTFALLLALQRSIMPYRRSVIDGRWEDADQFCYFDYPIADLSGKTIGIVGNGLLGKSVARIAEAFGMRVLFSSHKGVEGMDPYYTPFEEVMRISDVITLHCPLLPSTKNLISDAEFGMMERCPLLLNTARGGLVDEAALERALDADRISGAGFDVVSNEPPGEDHIMRRIAQRDNVIVTPHVAWASREAIQSLADQLIDNIDAFMEGNPKNVVV
ncbi:D-2-hydroxyacid dehydrogenase [Aidingimonas halophila]|uniref:Glycerate dehydrogenase n=1 Tax=Aidingimonas halophila TaxID=574349 RepID=A0A1H2X8H7_9GAMM|nr:D-2-hydroxyacid dehydrogenase [Aidingimonas halophila]GHC28306.1 glycerate dehydrogenase [Aidingimonas halophila]SDW89111.1 glycerate dehydrogenase [Aidingimonas halophila]